MCGSFSNLTSALISFGASNNLHMLLQILFPCLFTIIGPIFGKSLFKSPFSFDCKKDAGKICQYNHCRVLEKSGFKDI